LRVNILNVLHDLRDEVGYVVVLLVALLLNFLLRGWSLATRWMQSWRASLCDMPLEMLEQRIIYGMIFVTHDLPVLRECPTA
jgi:hypothetical protein